MFSAELAFHDSTNALIFKRSERSGLLDEEILRYAQDDSEGFGSMGYEILRYAQDDSEGFCHPECMDYPHRDSPQLLMIRDIFLWMGISRIDRFAVQKATFARRRMGDDLEEALLSAQQLRWKPRCKRSDFYC